MTQLICPQKDIIAPHTLPDIIELNPLPVKCHHLIQ